MSSRKTTFFYTVLIAVASMAVGMVIASRLDLSPRSDAQTLVPQVGASTPATGPVDATGPVAFGSYQAGPVGWVEEGTPAILARPDRRDAIDPVRLDARVDVIAAGLGDDGALVRAAVTGGADGLVVVALGAGHLPPGMLDAVEAAARRVPVVATVRPERGTVLHRTYGFRGSERDLRAGR